MAFEQTDETDGQLRGETWRPARPGTRARCYVTSVWQELEVTDFNVETREIRVIFGVGRGRRHRILSAAHYTDLSAT